MHIKAMVTNREVAPELLRDLIPWLDNEPPQAS
jgi:hypothetical protein